MRCFTVLGKGLLAATTLAAVVAASPIHAQYSPYPQTYTQPTQQAPQAQPAYAQVAQPQQQYVQPARQPVAAPVVSQGAFNPQQPPQQNAPANVYAQYAPAQGYNPARPGVASTTYPAAVQTVGPALGYPQQASQQQAPPQQQTYAAPHSVPRVAFAPQVAETVTQVPVQNGNDAYIPQPVAGQEYAPAQGYPAQAGVNGNYQTNGYESYPSQAETSAYGACSTYSTHGCDQPGAMARVLGKHCGNYWFGGVYGLLMERDAGDKVPLAFATAPLPIGDYPPADSVVLTTRNVDLDYMPGVEFRLGRTFGAGCDPCGCACGPSWGLEAVYWTLFEDDATAQYVDNGAIRVYSMIDPRGLEYDNGAGYRPVRHYWDYAPPTEDHTAGGDIEVRLARVRSSFEVQNVEVNLLRLGVCGDTCGGPAMCSVGCDGGACGTDACAGGACGTGGYGRGCRPSRFSCTGVCGVRYLQFDEEFMYGVDFDGPTDGFLDYWSEVENNLVGFQVGCNGMYRVGCKWGFHVNSSVGVYGNDIDVRQYMNSPTGLVRFIDTTENFDVSASKTDVAMLGELRLGASYQATCHCRLYGGWRAMGVSGIALATDQAPSSFISAAQLANYVNSNGSLILHGLQTGVEWNY